MNQRPHRGVQIVLALQAVVLAVFAVASLVVIGTSAGTVAEVIGFRMNILHSAILLVVAVLSGLALLRVRTARTWVAVQAVGFMLLFVIGTALSANRPQDTRLALDQADNLGHLALGIVGVALAMFMAAPWLTGNRVPGRKQTGEESLTSGVGEPGAR